MFPNCTLHTGMSFYILHFTFYILSRIAAVFDGGRPFTSVTDTLPPWLHNPEWNIVRFTGRGTDELAESLVLSLNGTAFRFR